MYYLSIRVQGKVLQGERLKNMGTGSTLDRILELMNKHGETQVDLANLLGITKDAVSKWKTGRNKAYDFKAQRVKEPKTAAGIRRIPIPDKYLQELNQWQAAHQDTFGDRKWVFAYKGMRLTESVFNEVWGALLDAMNGITLSDRISGGIRATKAAKAAGKTIAKGKHYKMYRAITFTSHQLRHTYATNCIAAGIDVRTVQYLMGHGTAEMTLKYTHLSQYALSAARGKLNHTSDDAKKS